MTHEEARKLKPGDRVEILYKGEWLRATVLKVDRSWAIFGARPAVSCQPSGLTPKGRGRRPVARWPEEVRPPRDPVSANVFSDWLDDHGFVEAADALRKAFPIGDGKGEK